LSSVIEVQLPETIDGARDVAGYRIEGFFLSPEAMGSACIKQ